MTLSRKRNASAALCAFAFCALTCGDVAGAEPRPTNTAAARESTAGDRDAEIADLQRRIGALERMLEAATAPRDGDTRMAASETMRGLKAPSTHARVEDDDALARALERSLVLSGGVLLPKGTFEVTPALRYDYTRRSGLAIVPPASIAMRDVRRENYVASLGLRAGLPWRSQLELTVPYGRQEIESVTGATPTGAAASGIGDVQVGVSKELFGETRRRPSLIGNVAWRKASERSNLAQPTQSAAAALAPVPALGAGYDALTTTLTAVKRMDPLVFTASLGRAFNQSADAGGLRIDPADTNSAAFRAILAASPDVSLRGGFSLARTGNVKVNGVPLASSRQNAALLEVGGSLVLSRRTLLDVTLAAGVTQDAPDFVLGVSLPIRF
jgi:hypothetical protein